ncbi:MAG: DEAD/DEAH box helicase [Microbacteriaceae bacterium]|nr:DEAD/DEAH box helicase [Microbacteriaceae bacterium]
MPRSELLDRSVAQAFFGAFKELHPAQAAAVPAILAGGDAIILAGTGSGKTEAAIAPLVSKYLSELQTSPSPVILYIAPTRALVNDIFRRLEPALDRLSIRVGVRHGELNHLDRVNKPVVLITTPESLDVMLSKRRELLLEVRAVIIDEAHLLYNTQRGLQLAILIERLQSWSGREVQVAAMSATVADYEALWAFYRPSAQVVVVRDQSQRSIERVIRIGWSPAQLASDLDRLTPATGGHLKALVFADSRKTCDKLAAALRENSSFGDRVFAHHSSLSKQERLRTEKFFAEFNSAVCVATSTLELGIDIGDIDLVVLWGHPVGWESFLQRIGRGNRRTSKTVVLCVIPDDESHLAAHVLGFQTVLEQVAYAVESPAASDIFGAACQQIVSLSVASSGKFTAIRDVESLLGRWPHLDREATRQMVEELVSEGVLVKHPVKSAFGPSEGAYALEDDLVVWSNFPVAAREVPVYEGSHHLGHLQGQNFARLEVGAVFTFAGNRYVVLSLRRDLVTVARTTRPLTTEIKYSGAAAPLDPTLVESMWQLVRSGDVAADVLPTSAGSAIAGATSVFRGMSERTLPYWSEGTDNCYLTFGGILLNTTIANWLGDGARATEISVRSGTAFDPARLPATIDALGPHLPIPRDEVQTVFQQLLPPTLLHREAMDSWVKLPVYRRALDRLRASRLVEVVRPTSLAW